MATVEEFREYTNTPKRRHNFYCYCTKRAIQENAIFFLLVEAYRQKRQKRQAQFINDWFIDGNIPKEFTDSGYLAPMNISAQMKAQVSRDVINTLTAVGKTFKDKISRHGGGFTGFLGAVGQKLATDTSVSGDLFDGPQAQAATMMTGNNDHGFGKANTSGLLFDPDATYQPSPFFNEEVLAFKRHLTLNGFSPTDLGIY